ncbi:membrane protein [Bacillus coahuilensis m2-6]|uniref:Probable membrane transporter protein n=1 Tax=Bacillus coahuilensis p1.1.43 TaxID=1150625 RepID=A0A147K689_9BACI|nr:sulfite exporter TauE/SafE family protein [Bacillus coahuilensis]KUP05281.1 membrane protein [Bacillus coahuilensis p1.1.43]KUP05785.1 membrane protein [Bacillus coahuilensis m2-6]
MEWIVLVFIGLFAGALGALAGLGGGVIIVPALLFFGGMSFFTGEMTPQIAVGTSLVIMIFTGLSSTLSYLKRGTVDYKSGLLFFAGSGPGGIVGAWINKGLDMDSFTLYFGFFMIFISIILMVRNKLKPFPFAQKGKKRSFQDADGNTYEYHIQPVIAIASAFIVGLTSGLFGIGGGSLMVPAMILLFLFPPHVAVATSMFMIFLSAIVSSVTHIAFGNVDWLYALALIPGAWLGAKLGAYLNSRLQSDSLVMVLRIILILVGAQLIYQGLVG